MQLEEQLVQPNTFLASKAEEMLVWMENQELYLIIVRKLGLERLTELGRIDQDSGIFFESCSNAFKRICLKNGIYFSNDEVNFIARYLHSWYEFAADFHPEVDVRRMLQSN